MRQVAVVAITFGDRVLLTQRSQRKTSPLEWHLPGGEREDGETLEHCAHREVYEELGIWVPKANLVHVVTQVVDDKEMHGYFFEVNELPPVMANRETVGMGWFRKGDVSTLPFCKTVLEALWP